MKELKVRNFDLMKNPREFDSVRNAIGKLRKTYRENGMMDVSKKGRKWSEEETELLKDCLHIHGKNYELISTIVTSKNIK